jgi:GPI-anchor transamidase subunit S
MDDNTRPESSSAARAQNKKPPPESPTAIRTRQLVILSFWAIVIFLGLPIWWKTTTIYRAELPLELMDDWAEGKICRPTFPLRIAVEASASSALPLLASQDLQHLLKNTQHALDDLNDFPIHHIRLLPSEEQTKVDDTPDGQAESIIPVPDDIALLIRLIPVANGHTTSSRLHTYSSVLDVYYSSNQIPSGGSSTSPLAMYIAKELETIFSEEQASLGHALGMTSWGAPQMVVSVDLLDALNRRSTRSFKYAPTYHLTFSLFTPTSLPSNWEIESALDQHISPLLASLSSISNFTVDTQVQLYAGFSPSIKPEFDADRQVWSLSKDDLSGFINAAEWPLSPNIGAGPTINFILYVPAPHQSPLVVRNEESVSLEANRSSSWLIPQWGGVQILNLHSSSNTVPILAGDPLQSAMRTFSTQLLSLLGLPLSPVSLPLRLSTLTRVHAATLIYSASSTVGALARLTRTLPSISIPNQVAHSVDRSLEHLTAACASLRSGKFEAALEEARIAEQEAESAFFEKTMVGQVYFPDEHKVAVYLPLLGPIAVPLVMSALKEFRKFKDRKLTA